MDVGSKPWLSKVERGERWTRADAEAALRVWQGSGLPLATFAKQHGIVPQRLHWWRRRLGWTVNSMGSRSAGGEGAVTFVELSWVRRAVDASRPPEQVEDDAGIEVVLARGCRVLIRRHFDAETLRRVVAALEAVPC